MANWEYRAITFEFEAQADFDSLEEHENRVARIPEELTQELNKLGLDAWELVHVGKRGFVELKGQHGTYTQLAVFKRPK